MSTRRIGSFVRALLVAFVALSAVAVTFARYPAAARADAPDHADAVETFARDVFVIVGASLRNPDDTTAPDAALFNNAGVNLGATWGQWKGASATSRAQSNGKNTDLRIQLTGLIPGGVYSLFYGTLSPDSENPLCPGVERTLPLISTDKRQSPDPASFVAGADGTAEFRGTAQGDLLTPYQSFITLVYHLDGHTWYPLPNHGEFNTQGSDCRSSFGEDAMRQLIIWQKFG